jgi:hypothetical protein
VEHQDRLTRFGFKYIEAALRATRRQVVVLNNTECTDDLVQDMIEVLALFCVLCSMFCVLCSVFCVLYTLIWIVVSQESG